MIGNLTHFSRKICFERRFSQYITSMIHMSRESLVNNVRIPTSPALVSFLLLQDKISETLTYLCCLAYSMSTEEPEMSREYWCVCVGTAVLNGVDIQRLIARGQKTFKYMINTPNVVGCWLALRVNTEGAPRDSAGISTVAIKVGAPVDADVAFQESMGWNPAVMKRTGVPRPTRAYPIEEVRVYSPIRVHSIIHVCDLLLFLCRFQLGVRVAPSACRLVQCFSFP